MSVSIVNVFKALGSDKYSNKNILSYIIFSAAIGILIVSIRKQCILSFVISTLFMVISSGYWLVTTQNETMEKESVFPPVTWENLLNCLKEGTLFYIGFASCYAFVY